MLALADIYGLAVHIFVPPAPEMQPSPSNICRPLVLKNPGNRSLTRVHLSLIDNHFTALTGSETLLKTNWQQNKDVTALLDDTNDIALDKCAPVRQALFKPCVICKLLRTCIATAHVRPP